MKTAFRSLSHRSALATGALAVLVILLAALAINGSLGTTKTHAATTLPTPSHVVVVMEENHSFNEFMGSSGAPYINSLANSGGLFTNSFAIIHPSEPNYLAIFSGSTQGLADDSCPHTFVSPDLCGELINIDLTFGGYFEGLPSVGSTVCTPGEYARKHSPWVIFPDVPFSDNMPFTSFPSDYNNLPKISFVIPNLLAYVDNVALTVS